MSNNNPIKRRCCACRQLLDRQELVKITLEATSKNIHINPDNKTFGRSVYVCPKKECIEKGLKKNLILNKLKAKISDNNKQIITQIKGFVT